MSSQVSFIPIGGIGNVTRNMYLYEYDNQILVIDCGLGFADETMIGVDLLLPDISYLLRKDKKIVGMALTHGHEDHIGALPFLLPQIFKEKGQQFPIFGTPLTAALANEKLKEFGSPAYVQTVKFEDGEKTLGNFKISFIRITHSVPDASNIFIKTPIGNFYHGSDFKFDLTPVDGKRADFSKIIDVSKQGVTCLMSDCLGAEKKGHAPSEEVLSENFEREAKECKGKFIITTYSSNISRLNQAISTAEKLNRRVCFVGRSLIKAKEVAFKLGYLKLKPGQEISIEQIKNYPDNRLLLIVAGSQGQENSAMTRIANNEHREIKLTSNDVVVFSADPIPGNEISVNSLIDTIAKKGANVIYSDISDEFHVSGHGYSNDLMLMMSLVKPKKLLPIGGNFKHMVAYEKLAEKLGYNKNDILLVESGQEVIFSRDKVFMGQRLDIRNVYVDEITGEEVDSFVLRDRQKLSEGGVVILLVEIDSSTGQIIDTPEVISRGFSLPEKEKMKGLITQELTKLLKDKKGQVTNWIYLRKMIGEMSERLILQKLHRHPLVLPIIVEV
ncbi:ribonuclease J [Patescibacteria group bacterium]|nr:ribonuclease J [Patescibacteria group bacterium]